MPPIICYTYKIKCNIRDRMLRVASQFTFSFETFCMPLSIAKLILPTAWSCVPQTLLAILSGMNKAWNISGLRIFESL